jgi:hypothetical protein
VRIFVAAKSAGSTADAFGRGPIPVSEIVLYVVDVVWQPLTDRVKQLKSGIEQDAKEWFSLSESHGVSRTIVSPVSKMQNGPEMLASSAARTALKTAFQNRPIIV